jgi:hypothetical protein
VFALARKPVPEAAPFLRAALGSSDPGLAATAARGLGVLQSTDAAAELAGLAMGSDSSVVIQALLALEKIAAKGEVPSAARRAGLARAMDGRPGVRVAALRLLGRFPNDDEARLALEGAIREEGWAAHAALVSLVRAYPEKGLERCLEKVRGESLDLKLGAAEALPLIPEPGRTRLAQVLLAASLPRVRAAVLSAGDSLSNELVARGLADRDAAVRATRWKPGRCGARANPVYSKAWDTAFESLLREAGRLHRDGSRAAAARAPGQGTRGAPADASDAIVGERARKLSSRSTPCRGLVQRIPVRSIFDPAICPDVP